MTLSLVLIQYIMMKVMILKDGQDLEILTKIVFSKSIIRH